MDSIPLLKVRQVLLTYLYFRHTLFIYSKHLYQILLLELMEVR